MFQDWISVFQLGAALSFVLGGFANHRQPREEKIEKWAKEGVEHIAILRARDGGEVPRLVPKGVMLDTVPGKDMSTTDLNDYRRDVTYRYHKRIEKYERNDRVRQVLLWINGVISAAALIYGSAHVQQPVSLDMGVVFALMIIGIPIACMVSVWLEDLYLVRQANPYSRSDQEERGRKITIRSNARRGQTFYVFTEIRRRFKDMPDKKRDAA
ncbi:hypothetical protein [Rhizobium sp. BK068]|uniref:hypothetical protein n=1 Tax=Rhizobium sp. BK068 TaxID=2512130 RepID=UPI00104C0DC6|nr:hypothetical protein [Rhizobium sp. BK068]TCM65755.1 hypothetical protein EV291_14233 [Rhizobium sp. BK068]